MIIESPFDRLLTTVENRFAAVGLPPFPLARMLVFWGGVQQGYDGFSFNPVDYAALVHCPVLVFQGGLDPRVTTPQARNVFDHLGGAKQWELFDDCGHCSFLSGDPVRWAKAVVLFLDETSRTDLRK